MSLLLPIADHPLITAIPFVAPAFLVVLTILGMRALDRRRDSSGR